MTTTLVRPWRPGQDVPRGTLRLVDERTVLLLGIERRIRTLFHDGRALRRILHRRPEQIWLQDLYLGLLRDRRELAVLFADRRRLRAELAAPERNRS